METSNPLRLYPPICILQQRHPFQQSHSRWSTTLNLRITQSKEEIGVVSVEFAP